MAAQAMAVCRLAGGSATTASVSARCRCPKAPSPAAPPLFLDVDDRFRASQALRQAGNFTLQARQFTCQRVGRSDFGAAFDRNQRTDCPGITQLAPLGQHRRGDPLATEDGADPTTLGHAIGLREDAKFFLRCELPPNWTS